VTTEREGDQLLVERVQAGDRQAFDLLVAKYQRRLMRLVSRLVHDPAEAEDVVQETFIKAFRALRHFRGESAFYTWAVSKTKCNTLSCRVPPCPESIPI
jgi:RNA polymerase sigma-70 factor (ECF subfamily)